MQAIKSISGVNSVKFGFLIVRNFVKSISNPLKIKLNMTYQNPLDPF
jgi:hypothetical protein